VLIATAFAAWACLARAESLFDAGSWRPLTSDRKAFRVGDLLTINVFEMSSATTTTDTSTQRNNALEANLGSSAINGGRPLTGSVSVGGTFEGGGTTQRTNRLLTTITVVVHQVLPNGDLCVAGEQDLTVNQEQHRVKLEGTVRPQDISADNVVLSTRLADARLSYAGKGDLSDRSRRAWWRSLVDWLGF
jgi:flagellar L-ring protein precursor FlgH